MSFSESPAHGGGRCALPALLQESMDLDIDGRIHGRWLQPRQENRVEFDVSAEPLLLHVDHEGTWLAENATGPFLAPLRTRFAEDAQAQKALDSFQQHGQARRAAN